MKRITKDGYEIEYDPKLAFIRISALLIIISLFYFLIQFFFISSETKTETFFSETILNNVNQYPANSRGDFISLRKDIFVQGDTEITIRNKEYHIKFTNFKITNIGKMKLIVSTQIYPKSTIDIAPTLLGTIGDQEYLLPTEIEYNLHKYLILMDSNENEPVAYVELDFK